MLCTDADRVLVERGWRKWTEGRSEWQLRRVQAWTLVTCVGDAQQSRSVKTGGVASRDWSGLATALFGCCGMPAPTPAIRCEPDMRVSADGCSGMRSNRSGSRSGSDMSQVVKVSIRVLHDLRKPAHPSHGNLWRTVTATSARSETRCLLQLYVSTVP